MRILFVHTIGRLKYGGGERWVINAASGLRQLGHQCFIASKPGSLMLEKAREKQLATLPVNIFSDVSIYHAIKLARFMRQQRIDLVISKRRDLAVAGLAARMGRNPTVLVRSGAPPQKSLRKHVFLISRLADGLITNTESIKQLYRSKGMPDNNCIRVIYNGMLADDDTAAFDFNKEYPGKTIILSVGRLVAAKGYFHLVDAVANLRPHHPGLLFYVAGDGKDKDRIIDYAKKKNVLNMMAFAGYVDKAVPLMKGCDLFLHPSLYEGMPNAAMEAMAYGKPVIMTEVNGARELSKDGKLAVLIPPANARAIAEAVQKAVASPERCQSMAAEASKYVRNTFSNAKMLEQLEVFIKEKRAEKHSK